MQTLNLNITLLSDFDQIIKSKKFNKSFTEKATETAEEFRSNVTGSRDPFETIGSKKETPTVSKKEEKKIEQK